MRCSKSNVVPSRACYQDVDQSVRRVPAAYIINITVDKRDDVDSRGKLRRNSVPVDLLRLNNKQYLSSVYDEINRAFLTMNNSQYTYQPRWTTFDKYERNFCLIFIDI